MNNYAEEFAAVLKVHNYTLLDIAWVGTTKFKIPVSEFISVAKNTIYNAGYGRPKTPGDIIVVMEDGSWFKRNEYDGSEYWTHEIPPIEPIDVWHIQSHSFNYEEEKIEPDNWTPMLSEYCMK